MGHTYFLSWESRGLYRISGKVVTEDEIGQSEPRIRKKIGGLDGAVGTLNIENSNNLWARGMKE